MFYLVAGLTCLIAVACRGGGLGLAAGLGALAAFAYAFLIYDGWIPLAAAVTALAAGYTLSLALRRLRWTSWVALAGAALAAFSVFGPADGLF